MAGKRIDCATVIFLGGALFVLSPPAAVHAQGGDDVEVVIRQAPAGKADTGGAVDYTTVYRNRGKAPADAVMAVIRIPEGMQYVPRSARPGEFLASLDGRMYYAPPLFRTARLPDGRERRVGVPESDYRMLGWNLAAIAPGASASVSARLHPRRPAEAGESPSRAGRPEGNTPDNHPR